MLSEPFFSEMQMIHNRRRVDLSWLSIATCVQKAGCLMTMFAGVALVGTAGHHELLAHRRGCAPPEGSAGSDLRGPGAKFGERLPYLNSEVQYPMAVKSAQHRGSHILSNINAVPLAIMIN
jgi:hypothetical protein